MQVILVTTPIGSETEFCRISDDTFQCLPRVGDSIFVKSGTIAKVSDVIFDEKSGKVEVHIESEYFTGPALENNGWVDSQGDARTAQPKLRTSRDW